ncbi:ParB domain protein nuclease [Ignisphaera aggregans DSM 17230]|uniref:ParB domain protein nuclease n=1 Tax=Ignisphaera aggregans (strain DSM 17230 / JCM 13409 / AQ1.S1) TaxID=583356 RepID=E0SQU5_IGNAA|nr:ParB domain protein nuclease [Ignisphaera aggregans DSM 17230]
MEITFRYINDLVPHEEIEYSRARDILTSILGMGYIYRPIIIEKTKNIIIDGHHRFYALKMLGFKWIPVVEAEYRNDIKFISSWMYISDKVYLEKSIEKFFNELLYSVKHGSSSIFMKFGDNIYSSMIDQIDFYLAIKEFNNYRNVLSLLNKIPLDIDICISYNICIAMPQLGEQDIYRVVSRGILLPPRTTYHITYLKSLRRDIPLYILKKMK